MREMSTLRVRLLGRISVQRDGRGPIELPARSLDLLAFLLIHRDRPHTREALSVVLWPEAGVDAARKYLRQTLWQLQSALEVDLLVLDSRWVRVDPDASWWLDVSVLEQAHAHYRDAAGDELTAEQARTLGDAVELYRGDLLESRYQDWCIYERDRLQLTYLAMLEQLMGYCEAHGLHAQGVAHGHRILRLDPARETTHRQLMRLHHQAGDRTTALRQYERCAQALAREFELTPGPETVALRRRIREDSRDAVEEPHDRLLRELHRQLQVVQASVAALHTQVQRVLTGE